LIKRGCPLEAEATNDNLPPVGFGKTDTKTIVRLGYILERNSIQKGAII
jgi:hypothetical protein